MFVTFTYLQRKKSFLLKILLANHKVVQVLPLWLRPSYDLNANAGMPVCTLQPPRDLVKLYVRNHIRTINISYCHFVPNCLQQKHVKCGKIWCQNLCWKYVLEVPWIIVEWNVWGFTMKPAHLVQFDKLTVRQKLCDLIIGFPSCSTPFQWNKSKNIIFVLEMIKIQ